MVCLQKKRADHFLYNDCINKKYVWGGNSRFVYGIKADSSNNPADTPEIMHVNEKEIKINFLKGKDYATAVI